MAVKRCVVHGKAEQGAPALPAAHDRTPPDLTLPEPERLLHCPPENVGRGRLTVFLSQPVKLRLPRISRHLSQAEIRTGEVPGVQCLMAVVNVADSAFESRIVDLAVEPPGSVDHDVRRD